MSKEDVKYVEFSVKLALDPGDRFSGPVWNLLVEVRSEDQDVRTLHSGPVDSDPDLRQLVGRLVLEEAILAVDEGRLDSPTSGWFDQEHAAFGSRRESPRDPR
jgi:hypothetical protein